MEIEAKIVANAKQDNIQMENGQFKIRISEQPIKGKANKAIEKLIENELGYKAKIIAGATNSKKRIQLECNEQELVKKIGDINGKNVH
ncbi:MAG: DUF167 domain-containing protein [Candidatus Micrarchaeia archaeon]|jgi:uncharacterized protein YggU (UPF0235/DUF167 family)